MANIPNIEFSKPNKNPTIDSESSNYMLPFFKDTEYFTNLDNFVFFVKAVEKMVRSSKYYSRYVKYIKEDIGLNYCQVLSNIKVEEEDNTELEMHHGPILTLFDYVAIMLDHMLYNDKKISTFRLADKILQEHYDNHVQVVMISKTVHEEVHNGNIFLNAKQAFGDINAFLSKYKDGISEDQKRKINRYIALCEEHDSFDKHTLQLKDNIKNWAI